MLLGFVCYAYGTMCRYEQCFVVQRGRVLQGTVLHDVAWRGVVLYGVVCSGMSWYFRLRYAV